MLMSCFIGCLLFFSQWPFPIPEAEKPQNIILIIADGMGLAHISFEEYLQKTPSILSRMDAYGLQKTHSSTNLETDSGASATAIACGVKTFNSAIGVDADTIPVRTIMEMARDHGLKTGFVVTSSVVHATPAAFYAHVGSRGSYEEIAKQLVSSRIDVFVGGGEKYFYNRNTDATNLLQTLRNRDYEVIRHIDPPGKFKFEKISKARKIACFTSFEDPIRADDGRIYLADMALEAMEALKKRSDKGYFLMIEASQIDWASHANDQEWLSKEMKDFYNMLDVLTGNIDPASNTLLIITSDHETGYISLKGKRSPRIEFESKVHSSQMVPVFARGPGAEEFAGVYENTAIFDKMKFLLNLN